MATPFGASSSVYSWERVGALICTIARRALRIATFRYVDDFFAAERYVHGARVCSTGHVPPCSHGRPQSVEHAMQAFARLVRVLLGTEAIADRKLEFGASLVVLGVHVWPSAAGFALRPEKAKVLKCVACIKEALHEGVLQPGCAQKLAGRLSWATQYLFRRVGRAMLRPIFDHRWSRSVLHRPAPPHTVVPWFLCGAVQERSPEAVPEDGPSVVVVGVGAR